MLYESGPSSMTGFVASPLGIEERGEPPLWGLRWERGFVAFPVGIEI